MKKVRFSDIFDDITKMATKIPKSQYLSNGIYQIIDQGKTQIAGYTNKEDGLFTDVPVIIFGDHTRVFKYVDKPLFLGADGVKLLKAKDKNLNQRYLFYVLCNVHIPNTGYNRHFKWLKEVEIPIVSFEEQQKIASVLDKVSDLIALRKQQLAKLDELVKSRFIEMFGDPVKNTQKRVVLPLKDLMTNIRYGTSQPPAFSPNGAYKFVRATNIKNGHIVPDDMLYISQEEANKIEKCKLSTGEIIIVRSGANTGDTCVISPEYSGHYAGYDIIITLNTDVVNPVFLNALLNTHYMQLVIKPLTIRSAQPHLNTKQVQELPIISVPLDEQNTYVSLLEQTDKSKSTIQKSLAETQLLFDSLLQTYFG